MTKWGHLVAQKSRSHKVAETFSYKGNRSHTSKRNGHKNSSDVCYFDTMFNLPAVLFKIIYFVCLHYIDKRFKEFYKNPIL